VNIAAPHIEYGLLAPVLAIFAAAVAGVFVEALVAPAGRYLVQLALSVGGLIVALVAVLLAAQGLFPAGHTAAMGAMAVDGPALYLQGTLLLVGFPALLLVAERAPRTAALPARRFALLGATTGGLAAFTPVGSSIPDSVHERRALRTGAAQTEVFPLLLLSLGGMLVLVAADDLITVFVALEVVSLPLYALCGLARYRRGASQEAALKYLLLGAFSSGLLLYGVALLYGYAGSLTLSGIATAVGANAGGQSMALVGVGLLAVGLLFKVGAVPFHTWIPDVYQGAPTPITAFMAAATKIAAFGALIRVFYVALPGFTPEWRPVLSVVAVVTMVVGALLTTVQTDVKRLVAYSAVTNTGFILTGVVAGGTAGLSAVMFYLFAYGFSTLGAFAVVGMVRDDTGSETSALADWAGLGRGSPLLAMAFAFFLLAMAGIPLTSGFVGKFAVFKAAAANGATSLVIVAVLASAIAAFAYLRVVAGMFFAAPTEGLPRAIACGRLGSTSVAITVAVTAMVGIAPQPVLDLVARAAHFLR
jgi:NADH-quinone oxidoreductase subunit N